MFWFRLPLRAPLPGRSRKTRRARTVFACAWLAMVCGLMTVNPSELRPADGVPPSPQRTAFDPPGMPSMPPCLTIFAGYTGQGIWTISGTMHDDQPVDNLTVWLTGGPCDPAVECAVGPNGDWQYSVYCSGGSTVFANATDAQGLAAQEAFTRLGF